MTDLEFYRGKKVFITGHTGFKGAWLSKILIEAGAEVTGYALDEVTDPSLFSILKLENNMNSIIGDIRDFEKLMRVFKKASPEIVFHLAAQPIVSVGYENPVITYETNVMGTVNLLECIRVLQVPVKSVINVTTDKVYYNQEWCWGYRENEELNGYDPYSNSKSCSELVTSSYCNSFLNTMKIPVSTLRAGNVIGGGDFAKSRIIPDCIRAVLSNEPINVRNPHSIRPYQHVIEPIIVYLMIAQKQYEDFSLLGAYNIGPNDSDCVTTEKLVNLFYKFWGSNNIPIYSGVRGGIFHEANFLRLDCMKLKTTFNWKPKWNIERAIEKTVEWVKCWKQEDNVSELMNQQIKEYLNE